MTGDEAVRGAYFEATTKRGLSLTRCPHGDTTTYLVALDGTVLGNVSASTGGGWWAYPLRGGDPTGPHDTDRQAAESLRVHVADTPEGRDDLGRFVGEASHKT
jgi:hypothetical protein